MIGLHWPEIITLFWLISLTFVVIFPWYLGFTWVRVDANRRGQPGWLWAFVTVPLGWVAILAYLAVRGMAAPHT
ncbi:MAG TPA: hypothetical protein VKQ30_17075 [Ktedonobacterales bacterium]|nr:hypothetical protein [Ktedonobacterales bacterium]